MRKKLVLILLLGIILPELSFGQQVRIRLFAAKPRQTALLTVTQGEYEVSAYDGKPHALTAGQSVILSVLDGRLAVKAVNSRGYSCDSVLLRGKTGKDIFSLRVNGGSSLKQLYSGDLQCYPDLGFLVLINNCDVEQYVAGVVKAEGGSGWNIEYFKTQAVLARTYMYKYFDRHTLDRFNLCDDTHCQAFNGITIDQVILRAALETHGEVVLDRDSILIMSAFHSNCGGETAASENVWLSSQPYLKRVKDPYCVNSRNATWKKTITLPEWENYLKSSGYRINGTNPSGYTFSQLTRTKDYNTGNYTIPFLKIRNDLNLRSAFFSVINEGGSVVLRGRGFGHGVGLCQEGAMSMAAKGFKYKQIISFYYTGVMITDAGNTRKSKTGSYPGNNF